MGTSLRYNMEHIGDILVDRLVNSLKCLTLSTRGIVLTYDLHELEKNRKKLQLRIGQRVEAVKKGSPEAEIFQDEELLRLFSSLDAVNDRIDQRGKERETRLNPNAAEA
jgi:hypothetical protein